MVEVVNLFSLATVSFYKICKKGQITHVPLNVGSGLPFLSSKVYDGAHARRVANFFPSGSAFFVKPVNFWQAFGGVEAMTSKIVGIASLKRRRDDANRLIKIAQSLIVNIEFVVICKV